MPRILPLLPLPLAFLPGAALAHPGDHAPLGPVRAAVHAVTEPDHLAAAAAVVAALALARRPLARAAARVRRWRR